MKKCQDIQEVRNIISQSQTLTNDENDTSTNGESQKGGSQSGKKLQALWDTKEFQGRLERLQKSHYSLNSKYSRRSGINKKDNRKESEIGKCVSKAGDDTVTDTLANVKQCTCMKEQNTFGLYSDTVSLTRNSLIDQKGTSSITSSVSQNVPNVENQLYIDDANHLDGAIDVIESVKAYCPFAQISRDSNDDSLKTQNDSNRSSNESKGKCDPCLERTNNGQPVDKGGFQSPYLIWHSFEKEEDPKVVSEKLTYSNIVRARLLNGGNSHLCPDMECYGNPLRSRSRSLPNSPTRNLDEQDDRNADKEATVSTAERIKYCHKIPSEFQGIGETANAKTDEIKMSLKSIDNTVAGNIQQNNASRTNERLADGKANTDGETMGTFFECLSEAISIDTTRTPETIGKDVIVEMDIDLSIEKDNIGRRDISDSVNHINACGELNSNDALKELSSLACRKKEINRTMDSNPCENFNSVSANYEDESFGPCQKSTAEIDPHPILQTEYERFSEVKKIRNHFKDKEDGMLEMHMQEQNFKNNLMAGIQIGNIATKELNQGVERDKLYTTRNGNDQTTENTSRYSTDLPHNCCIHKANDDSVVPSSDSSMTQGFCQITDVHVVNNTSQWGRPPGISSIGDGENENEQVFQCDMIYSNEIGSMRKEGFVAHPTTPNTINNSPVFHHDQHSKVSGSGKTGHEMNVLSEVDESINKQMHNRSMKTPRELENRHNGTSSTYTATPEASSFSIDEHQSSKERRDKKLKFCSERKYYHDQNSYEFRNFSDASSPKSISLPIFSSPGGQSITPHSQKSDVTIVQNAALCCNAFDSINKKCSGLQNSLCHDEQSNSGVCCDKGISQQNVAYDEREIMHEVKPNYAELQKRLNEFKKQVFIQRVNKGISTSRDIEESKTNQQPTDQGRNYSSKDHRNVESKTKNVDDSFPILSCVLNGSQVHVSTKPKSNVRKYKPRVKIKLKPTCIDKESKEENVHTLEDISGSKRQKATCFKTTSNDASKVQRCKNSTNISQVYISDSNHGKRNIKTHMKSWKENQTNHSTHNPKNVPRRLCIKKLQNMSKPESPDTTSFKTKGKNKSKLSEGSVYAETNRNNKEHTGLLGYSSSEKEASKKKSGADQVSDRSASTLDIGVEKHRKATRNGREQLFNIEKYHDEVISTTLTYQSQRLDTNTDHSDCEQLPPPLSSLCCSDTITSPHDGNAANADIQIGRLKGRISSLTREIRNFKSPEFVKNREHWRQISEADNNNRNSKDDSDESSASQTYRSLISQAITKARAQADKYKSVWGDSSKSKSFDKDTIPGKGDDTRIQTARSRNCPQLPVIQKERLFDFQSEEGVNSNNNSCADTDTDTNGKGGQQLANTGKGKQVSFFKQDDLDMRFSSEFSSHIINSLSKKCNESLTVGLKKNRRNRKSKIPVLVRRNSQVRTYNSTQDGLVKSKICQDYSECNLRCAETVGDYINKHGMNTSFLPQTETLQPAKESVDCMDRTVYPSSTDHQSLLAKCDLINFQRPYKDAESPDNCTWTPFLSGRFNSSCKADEPINDIEKTRVDFEDDTIKGRDVASCGKNEQIINAAKRRDESECHQLIGGTYPLFEVAECKNNEELIPSACKSDCLQNSGVIRPQLSPGHASNEICSEIRSGTHTPSKMTESDSLSTEAESGLGTRLSSTDDKPDKHFLQLIHQKTAMVIKERNMRILQMYGNPNGNTQHAFPIKNKPSQTCASDDLERQNTSETHPRDFVVQCLEQSKSSTLPGKSSPFSDRIIPKDPLILAMPVDAESHAFMPLLTDWPIPIRSEFSPEISRRPPPRDDLCQGIAVSSSDSKQVTESDLSQNFQVEKVDHLPIYHETTCINSDVQDKQVQKNNECIECLGENDTRISEGTSRSSEISEMKIISPDVQERTIDYSRYSVRVDRNDNKRVRFKRGSLTFCKEPPLCFPVIELSPGGDAVGNQPESMTSAVMNKEIVDGEGYTGKSIHFAELCQTDNDEKLDTKENRTGSATVGRINIEFSNSEDLQNTSDEKTENKTKCIEKSNIGEEITDVFKNIITVESHKMYSRMLSKSKDTRTSNNSEGIAWGDCVESNDLGSNQNAYFETLHASTENSDGAFSNCSKERERGKPHNDNNRTRPSLPPLSKRQAGQPHQEMRKRYY